jgi:Uncharacterized protein conserved in cyanobacteria
MGDPTLTPREHFTYRHYKTWPDTERWELIDGRAWALSPAPRMRHQDLIGRLYLMLGIFLKGKSGKVMLSPFDVLFPKGEEPDDEVDTVVQPDLVAFADRSKLTVAGARGAPDLVVEVLSPSTSKKDLSEKYRLYERSGVREYWVVDPNGCSIQVYRRDPAGSFAEPEIRERGIDSSPIASTAIEGFTVDPEELFADLD